MSLSSGSPSRSKKSYDCQGGVNAISASPDGTHIVVAGRDVLQVLKRTAQGFEEAKNLRAGHKGSHLVMSSNDCKWCPLPQCSNLIATAASNSSVVVWDIEARRKSERRVVYKEHSRSVNRVAWHSSPHCLMSASQDGTLRYWDLRTAQGVTTVFQPHGDAVRDVAFNPFYSNYFAAAFDNGTVQAWDLRKPSVCERRMTAHNGLVLCLDWHPDDSSVFASGGRDGTVKVWDLNQASKPIHMIQTVSSVAFVRWRPKLPFQLASMASLIDFEAHIWDLKRPHVPYASFRGHSDCISGMVWCPGDAVASQTLITAGKDGRIIEHAARAAYFPNRHTKATPIAWNARSQISCVPQTLNRSNPEKSANLMQNASHGLAAKVLPPSPLKDSRESVLVCQVPGVSMDAVEPLRNLSHFAGTYRLRGASCAELCAHNARVAREVGASEVANTWDLVGSIFGDVDEDLDLQPHQREPETPSTPPTPEVLVMPMEEVRDAPSPLEKRRKKPQKRNSKPKKRSLAAELFGYRDEEASSDSSEQDTLGEDEDEDGDNSELGGTGLLSSEAEESDYLRPRGQSAAVPFSHTALESSVDSGDDDSLPRRSSTTGMSASPMGRGRLSVSAKSVDMFRAEALMPVVPLTFDEERVPPPTSLMMTVSMDISDISGDEMHEFVPLQAEQPAQRVVRRALESSRDDYVPIWDPRILVAPLLDHYLDLGDIQMVFCLAQVLSGASSGTPVVAEVKFRRWTVHYLELLGRFRLWSARNEVINSLGWDDIRMMNNNSTTLYGSCPYCRTPSISCNWRCVKCNRVIADCTLCRRPVKGLMSWCQICGHGGHLLEMEQYWASAESNICPHPSCSHACRTRK